ncbi:MAG: PilZ domain-containing protein [Spirochaetes bacterium]|nr:PilZ domain-containing protein [Spirochaetota bacterium]
MKKFKYYIYERRKREKRPFFLKVFTCMVPFLPLYYYFNKIMLFDFNYRDLPYVISSFSDVELIVAIISLVVFFLLLSGLRFGYYLVLLLTLCFVFFNLYRFFMRGEIFNIEPVFLAFAGAAFFIYMTSPDNAAPFRRRYARGFRRELRRSFNHTVVVNDSKKVIENISSRGLLLRWKGSRLNPSDELELGLVLNRQKFEIHAGVVWADSDVVALAFRSLNPLVRNALYLRLKHIEEKRSTEHENI